MGKVTGGLLAAFYMRLALAALARGQDTEARRLFDLANQVLI